MPAIGSVNVKVTATTGGLVTGLNAAAGSVANFGSRISSIGSGVAGLAGKLGPLAVAAAGAAGVAGIGALVTSSMGAIDSTADLAAQIGISQLELTGYQHAAQLSGSSTDTLNAAIGKLTRKGLTIEELADQMSAIENPTDRAKLAFETLGKTGQELIPFLAQGGDKIRELADQGKALKGVTDLDASKIGEANDAIDIMKAAIMGVGNSLAVTLAPGIQFAADQVTHVASGIRTAFNAVSPIVTAWGAMVRAEFVLFSDVASSVFSFVGGTGITTFGEVRDFLVDTMLVAEFAFQNFGEVAALVWEKVKLGAVTMFNEIGHFFTAVVPAWFTWFGTNWSDVFFTAFDLATTVFINLGQNIRNMFSSLFEWITSGFSTSFEIDWAPLTAGFVNSVKSLPDIPDRAVTELEAKLAANVDKMGTSLGDRLGEHLVKRRAELFSPADAVAIPATLDITPPDSESMGLSKIGEVSGAAAVQRGSSDALSAIFKSMRGDPQDKMLKTAEQQLREQTKHTKALNKIADQPQVELVAGVVP